MTVELLILGLLFLILFPVLEMIWGKYKPRTKANINEEWYKDISEDLVKFKTGTLIADATASLMLKKAREESKEEVMKCLTTYYNFPVCLELNKTANRLYWKLVADYGVDPHLRENCSNEAKELSGTDQPTQGCSSRETEN